MQTLNEHTAKTRFINQRPHAIGIQGGTTSQYYEKIVRIKEYRGKSKLLSYVWVNTTKEQIEEEHDIKIKMQQSFGLFVCVCVRNGM